MTGATTEQTTPVIQGPSDKEKKYDRQLRLWAANGQQALEDAHILLVNSGAGTVGVEILKNLVLPGIGKFTIADDATVCEADLGVNFFLDEDCLGKPRSECCVKLLQELNPDAHGDWFPKGEDSSFKSLLSEKFTLILYTFPIEPQKLALIQGYGNKHQVPLICVHSAGFYSYFRINLPSFFPIVETHPESTATTDLRLLTPWEGLSKFAEELTKDIDNLNAHDHGHLPYVAIILHYLVVWKKTHGSLPSNYKEKTAFRDVVSRANRTDNAEGGEENFEEAVAAILKTVSAPGLSSSVREVFEHKPTESESASTFWIIADAVKQFYANHKVLPLPGSVPDMKAQSTVYVELQNIYKSKARHDAAEVLELVRKHPSGKEIKASEVDNFCKNAAFIKLIRGSDSSASRISSLIDKEMENDEMASMTGMPPSLLPIYLSLRATAHDPFASPSDIIATINKSNSEAKFKVLDNVAQEVARAKGGELHNISALTGGMVSQEVIKIITKQYIPIDNTCIFDGITSRTQVLRI